MDPNEELKLASTLLGQHRTAEAVVLYERLWGIAPTNPFVRLGLAACRVRMGRFDEGRAMLAEVRAANHDDPAIQNNLGNVMIEAGLFDEGLAVLKGATASYPRDVRIREDYVAALSMLDYAVEALHEAERAHADGIRTYKTVAAVAASRMQMGQPGSGVPLLRALDAELAPDPRPAECLARTAVHDATLSAEEIRDAHALFSQRLCTVLRVQARERLARRDDPERPIRVAFIGGDFHRHSVSYFLLPLVSGLRALGASADGGKDSPMGLDLRAFSTGEKVDEVTAAIERCMPIAQVRTLSPLNLVRRIKNERVDVLIELSGMTIAHRHGSLLVRCAPVQATYLGWPATTGNPSVDYRLIDSLTDPAGYEAHSTETLVRLDPCFVCYRPGDDAPEPGEPDAGRPFTFGSFNAQTKIHDGVIAAWARVLRDAPGARLLVKNGLLANERSRQAVYERFMATGMDPSRFELVGWTKETTHHLSLYDRVDLALDTFPYNGTTTTCEALHMGVPVLSLVGNRHAARVGLSLLSAVGMTDYLAYSEDEYVAKAVAGAQAGVRGRAARLAVRARLAASPLRDEPAFARRFADAVRWMWRQSVAR